MKNLKIINQLKFVGISCLNGCKFISIDPDTNRIFGANDFAVFLFQFHPEKQPSYEVLSTVSLKESGFLEADEHIVAIQYIVDQFALCIALSNGQIVYWNSPIDSNQLECVGCCEGELKYMKWSPDSELMVLVAGVDTVILMNRDFLPITKQHYQSSDFGEANFVSVGWGKKETQFHGSEGKQAAVKKQEELALLAWDDRRPCVTWRGDGLFFAVSFVSDATGVRSFKVWSREGVLHSTGTPTSGLYSCIAFMTQGNFLAGAVLHKQQHKIVFFEKIGLQHGEFCIPHLNECCKILEVAWNLDSTALSVLSTVVDTKDQEHSKYQVQIWTMCNYHWYLKCNLEYDERQKVISVIWDQEVPLRFYVVCSSGLWHTCTYASVVQQSSDDQTVVAVLDGSKILMTPFTHVVIPPPMSAYHLFLPYFAHGIAWSCAGSYKDIIVLSSNAILYWFTHSPEMPTMEIPGVGVVLDVGSGGLARANCPLPRLVAWARFASYSNSTSPSISHMTWINKSTLIACVCAADVDGGDEDALCFIVTHHINWEDREITVKLKTKISGGQSVISIDYNEVADRLFVQLNDGTCLSYDHTCGLLTEWNNHRNVPFSFPRPCSQASIVTYLDKCFLIGLTEQFRFFIDSFEVANNCTSYAVHNHFILFTTHAHTLQCIPISKLEDLDPSSLVSMESSSASSRNVERGSKLVCVVGKETKVVLQMPRGNLEVIHPRWLLIDELKKLLDCQQYRGAFEICKKHRINMNIFIDHNKSMFLEHIETFVQQLSTSSNINLFLSDLSNENFTKTMYAGYYATPGLEGTSSSSSVPPRSSSSSSSTKVDEICDSLYKVMINKDCDTFFLSILMTNLKRCPPNVEGALSDIKQLKEGLDALKKGTSPSTTSATATPTTATSTTDTTTSISTTAPQTIHVTPTMKTTTTEALKFIIRLVDVNELFNIALGTYDLQLVVMVAEMSHKDPKEFLPYLNELKEMPENLRKYTINMKLKRYSQALKYISACGDDHFVYCMKLVKEQSLYSEAFNHFKQDTPQYKEIAGAYGDDLKQKRCYETSGFMYYRAHMYQQALEMFEKIHNWRLALDCFYKIHHNSCNISSNIGDDGNSKDVSAGGDAGNFKLELVKFARQMSARLVEAHRHGEAAVLMENYADDYEETVNIYVAGHMWQDALALINRHSRPDLISANLLPAVLSALQEQKDLMKKSKEDFSKYFERLQVVRKMKKEKMAMEDFVDDERRVYPSDLYSDTSSVGDAESVTSSTISSSTATSRRSKNSGRSLKSKQKKNRKRWSLREGGPTEEFALMEFLHNSITSVQRWKDEVGQLARILVLFAMDKPAEELQAELIELVEMMDDSIERIWLSGGADQESPRSNMMYGAESSSNSISRSFNTADASSRKDANLSATIPFWFALLSLIRMPGGDYCLCPDVNFQSTIFCFNLHMF
ncbi:hypothetical protein HELRODRAFT_188913 [Helobdella robusta]|uniref:Elongator complex protein 1 n=1 Tax=Helobdella robusta TaxID=6412 RepID=T1FQH1_HELRO|nr:hypothetical protein HELRODRAFT_188913 [Helobdella robusta]ESN98799.1 hypothetical protein HELRODRAFT_188913 [Helobdella robusta]